MRSTFAALLMLAAAPCVSAADLWQNVRDDYAHYYRWTQLSGSAAFLLISGTLANSGADENIREEWQEHLRGDASDAVFDGFETFGHVAQWAAAIPIYAGVRHWSGSPAWRRWADRSLRAVLLTGPQHVTLGYTLGSPRPGDGPPDWKLFADNHTVSGHALYGAIPFLTTAHSLDPGWAKNSLVGVSMLPGLARVHKDRHYFSQWVLGWGLAWQATRFIAEREGNDDVTSVGLMQVPGGFMLSFAGKWN